MADTAISALAAGGAVKPADQLPAARAGADVSLLGSAFQDWIDYTADTWTYASADSPTFTFTITGDRTAVLTPGTRLKLTQSSTVKYFIVTAVSVAAGTTTVTVYGGTDYTLANSAISANHFSRVKAPSGFPLDVAKWTVETLFTGASYTKTSPAAGTWYGGSGLTPTGPSLSIPIGCWGVSFQSNSYTARSTTGFHESLLTLSTANNSASDNRFTTYSGLQVAAGQMQWHSARQNPITLAAKTTYFLNVMSTVSSGVTSINLYGTTTLGSIILRAVCAYL